jgi:predicted HTH transcriptional regulator
MKRIEKEDYPVKAVREAIVNAIIHRDYQIVGSEIHIDMFDDRLEIVSPGGMIDGSFIQDLDIKKISSMRRNRIISDIFNRLRFMDRRGSGLTRILESYNDYLNKPQFCSDVSSFKVVLPNKGYKVEKSPVSDQKSPVQGGNFVNDDDYFMIKMYKNLAGVVNNTTIEKVKKLFESFKYKYSFNREDVEKIFAVKKSRASEIISKLLDLDLIEDAEPTKYKFKK